MTRLLFIANVARTRARFLLALLCDARVQSAHFVCNRFANIFFHRARVSRGYLASTARRERERPVLPLLLSISLFLFSFFSTNSVEFGWESQSVVGTSLKIVYHFLLDFSSPVFFFSFFGNILLRIIVDVRKKRKEWKLILSRDPGRGRGGLIGYYFENVTSRLYVYIFFIFHDFSQILQLDL